MASRGLPGGGPAEDLGIARGLITSRRIRLAAAALTLVALAWVAFLPAVWSGFVSDDFLLLHNLHRAGGLGWVFSHNDAGEAGAAGHFYRPVWTLWNLGLYRAFGASTTAFHLASLVLYGLVTLEVWLLAASLVDRSRAWVAAAAFAVYPRHGESVSWVSANTDLVAVAAGLGALLLIRARLSFWVRIGSVALLTAAATLAKEVAFVLPLLALLVLRRRRRELVFPVAMVVVEAGVFAGRYASIGGFGGYSGYRWTPLHALGSAASYALAAATPPSVPAFRYWMVFLVPAAIVALAGWRFVVLWRRPDPGLSVAARGVVWFLVALLPLLSLPVDLNNANGERNLLLASVGLALALAALLPPVRGATRGVVAAALAGALALSLYSSFDWIEAGRLSKRLVPAAEALAPRGGELVLLSAPESYRTAHVFTGGDLSEVLGYRGRTGFTTAICVPVNVRELRRDEIRFRGASGAAYDGETDWAAPFDFPVLHGAAGLTGECSYSRSSGGPEPPGLGLRALAEPHPSRRPVVVAYFDGRDWRRCC